MLQDDSAIGWDPIYVHRDPSTAVKIYVLFSLVAILVMITRLITLWMAAPPGRLSRQANNAAYLRQLQACRSSLKQWMGFALLGWGLVASTDAYQACNHLLSARAIGTTLILLEIRDSSTHLSLALLVAIFLFLAQWHMLNRIERLGELTGGHASP